MIGKSISIGILHHLSLIYIRSVFVCGTHNTLSLARSLGIIETHAFFSVYPHVYCHFQQSASRVVFRINFIRGTSTLFFASRTRSGGNFIRIKMALEFLFRFQAVFYCGFYYSIYIYIFFILLLSIDLSLSPTHFFAPIRVRECVCACICVFATRDKLYICFYVVIVIVIVGGGNDGDVGDSGGGTTQTDNRIHLFWFWFVVCIGLILSTMRL